MAVCYDSDVYDVTATRVYRVSKETLTSFEIISFATLHPNCACFLFVYNT